MASVLIRPPFVQYSSRAGLRQAEIAALADDARANARRVDADTIVGAIADLGVVLARRLDVGADAAVVEQIDVHREDVANDLLAARRLGLQVEQSRAPPALSGISLADRSNTPPPALIVDGVVVGPRRSWQVEQSLALGEGSLDVRVRVDEDVLVIERGDEARRAASQHAVAEHVAGHVADAGAR